jgi:hypothetical protein
VSLILSVALYCPLLLCPLYCQLLCIVHYCCVPYIVSYSVLSIIVVSLILSAIRTPQNTGGNPGNRQGNHFLPLVRHPTCYSYIQYVLMKYKIQLFVFPEIVHVHW